MGGPLDSSWSHLKGSVAYVQNIFLSRVKFVAWCWLQCCRKNSATTVFQRNRLYHISLMLKELHWLHVAKSSIYVPSRPLRSDDQYIFCAHDGGFQFSENELSQPGSLEPFTPQPEASSVYWSFWYIASIHSCKSLVPSGWQMITWTNDDSSVNKPQFRYSTLCYYLSVYVCVDRGLKPLQPGRFDWYSLLWMLFKLTLVIDCLVIPC